MKNLKFESLQFNAKEMLTREQMKGIKGGSGGTLLCYCGGVAMGYCGCQHWPGECVQCCAVVCAT